ncbi:thiamine-phosphate diphosphorylase [Vibrio sp. TBV020]|uniref:thiamine-phosphate diphosphorylase n=1 Tax=Vibrio sp. TBV020 TaxID=3137398 RepID=UPI0038CD7FDC
MSKERIKREYDLRVLNCVSEGEYESRMAVWNGLTLAGATTQEAKIYVDNAFNKLQEDLKDAKRELVINYNEFCVMANEEINFIKVHVADNKSQYFWYATIALMVAGTIALCI